MKTRNSFRAGVLRAIIAAGVVGAAAPAMAQFQSDDAGAEGVSPPRPGKADESAPVVMTYLLGFVLLGAAVGANLIPPKRGHQD